MSKENHNICTVVRETMICTVKCVRVGKSACISNTFHKCFDNIGKYEMNTFIHAEAYRSVNIIGIIESRTNRIDRYCYFFRPVMDV